MIHTVLKTLSTSYVRGFVWLLLKEGLCLVIVYRGSMLGYCWKRVCVWLSLIEGLCLAIVYRGSMLGYCWKRVCVWLLLFRVYKAGFSKASIVLFSKHPGIKRNPN